MLTLVLPNWLTAASFFGLTPLQWFSAALLAALTYPLLNGLRRAAIRKLRALAASTAELGANSLPTPTSSPAAAATPGAPASGAGATMTANAPAPLHAPLLSSATLTVVAIALLDQTRRPMMIAVALLTGLSVASASVGFSDHTLLIWVQHAWQCVILLQAASWASRAIGLLSDRYLERHRCQQTQLASAAAAAATPGAGGQAGLASSPTLPFDDGINPVIVRVLSWFARALIWALFLMSLLSQAGVNITAFVASLSIGAAAIGFAVHGILSDLFASLAIGLDKPFRIGDFVSFGEVMGTIEQVGMKTTRIRALRGEEIICGNTELLKQQIHNFQRMQTRRIVFRFGLAYATSARQLRAVQDMVRQALAGIADTQLDRVHFATISERALEFEVVYYVMHPDYAVYMNCQHALNLAIVDGLAALGIAFAQPIREIRVLDGAPAPASTPAPISTSATTPAMP